MSIRLFSWNVNGFRAVLGKGFGDWLAEAAPDMREPLDEQQGEPEGRRGQAGDGDDANNHTLRVTLFRDLNAH